MKVEKRPVALDELSEFDEAGACGTAAVITPIRKIVDPEADKTYTFGDGKNPGPITTKLYEKLVGIQYGDVEDPFGWITILD
jgi:branched-chain amino acid aminotransferase